MSVRTSDSYREIQYSKSIIGEKNGGMFTERALPFSPFFQIRVKNISIAWIIDKLRRFFRIGHSNIRDFEGLKKTCQFHTLSNGALLNISYRSVFRVNT